MKEVTEKDYLKSLIALMENNPDKFKEDIKRVKNKLRTI